MDIWGLIGKISVVGGVIGTVAYILGAHKYLKNKIKYSPRAKRLLWKLRGKKIYVEFQSSRIYYSKIDVEYSDMKNLLRKFINILNEEFGGIDQEKKIGSNYIILRPKTLNVPLIIEILPNIGLDYELSRSNLEPLPGPLKEEYLQEYSEELYSDEGREIRIGTTVSIRLFGALTLLYREKEEYKHLLASVEKMYNIIEDYFHLGKPFKSHYVVKATVVTKDKKDSVTLLEKEEYEDWKLEIKENKVILYSKTLNPLKEIFDRDLPRIPTF